MNVNLVVQIHTACRRSLAAEPDQAVPGGFRRTSCRGDRSNS